MITTIVGDVDMPPVLREEIGRMQEMFGQGVVFPPPCFTTMNGRFLAYESRTVLTVSFPVDATMLNPVSTMQGGFITAAIDNVMGPLSYLAMRSPAATLDIHTQYIRGILPGDTLTVVARVVSRGSATIAMAAEARNAKGKLVATGTANAVVLKP